jgi:hypothetical protein
MQPKVGDARSQNIQALETSLTKSEGLNLQTETGEFDLSQFIIANQRGASVSAKSEDIALFLLENKKNLPKISKLIKDNVQAPYQINDVEGFLSEYINELHGAKPTSEAELRKEINFEIQKISQTIRDYTKTFIPVDQVDVDKLDPKNQVDALLLERDSLQNAVESDRLSSQKKNLEKELSATELSKSKLEGSSLIIKINAIKIELEGLIAYFSQDKSSFNSKTIVTALTTIQNKLTSFLEIGDDSDLGEIQRLCDNKKSLEPITFNNVSQNIDILRQYLKIETNQPILLLQVEKQKISEIESKLQEINQNPELDQDQQTIVSQNLLEVDQKIKQKRGELGSQSQRDIIKLIIDHELTFIIDYPSLSIACQRNAMAMITVLDCINSLPSEQKAKISASKNAQNITVQLASELSQFMFLNSNTTKAQKMDIMKDTLDKILIQ